MPCTTFHIKVHWGNREKIIEKSPFAVENVKKSTKSLKCAKREKMHTLTTDYGEAYNNTIACILQTVAEFPPSSWTQVVHSSFFYLPLYARTSNAFRKRENSLNKL